MKTSIVWLRNELRMHDNAPLKNAVDKSERVLPVYCFDPRHFGPMNWPTGQTVDLPKTGPHRTRFLIESVADLRASLRESGGDLIVRLGKPEEILPELAKQVGAKVVYCGEEITDEETRAEDAVESALAKVGVPLESYWQSTLFHIDDLPYPLNSLPDVYTQFRKSVEKAVQVDSPLQAPRQVLLPEGVEPGDVPEPEAFGLKTPAYDSRAVLPFYGGETEGMKRLEDYFWNQDLLQTYKKTRNGLLGADYSSKFSPWLANGSLSPRYVYEQIKAYEADRKKNDSTYWLFFELMWRDYFKFVARKYGNRIFQPEGLKAPDNKQPLPKLQGSAFQKWMDGETGVPFIDANMREIARTGFMSNRGRQNVASFLVKDLNVSMVYGAMYFESQLVDYDACSNWCNWNYVGGVGNDPREDRYFNILKQAERYDPKGEYVRHWVPELEGMPHDKVHAVGALRPKELQEIGVSYAAPLVNVQKWMKR